MKQKYRKDAFQDFESKMCKFRDNKKNFISIFHYFFFFLQKNHFFSSTFRDICKKKNCYMKYSIQIKRALAY